MQYKNTYNTRTAYMYMLEVKLNKNIVGNLLKHN